MTLKYTTECVVCGARGMHNLVPSPFYSPATRRNPETGSEELQHFVCSWFARCKNCFHHYGIFRKTEQELWDSYEDDKE